MTGSVVEDERVEIIPEQHRRYLSFEMERFPETVYRVSLLDPSCRQSID
jgi:hypothetical protein